jgi:hypothetical protein
LERPSAAYGYRQSGRQCHEHWHDAGRIRPFLCRETEWPFRFPGFQVQWKEITNMTDAPQLARTFPCAATPPAAAPQYFNVLNGDVFRRTWMWRWIAAWFDFEPTPFGNTVLALEKQMKAYASVWRRKRLYELDLGKPIEVVMDMSKSRRLGFTTHRSIDDAFFDLSQRSCAGRLIP